jgi:prepilin-type processing-associated H-X9-DG protein
LNNVRQIGLAYQGILSDNSDRFPAYVTERKAPTGTPDTAGTANITYADGHARSTITNLAWRTEQDNNWRRYQITSDIN